MSIKTAILNRHILTLRNAVVAVRITQVSFGDDWMYNVLGQTGGSFEDGLEALIKAMETERDYKPEESQIITEGSMVEYRDEGGYLLKGRVSQVYTSVMDIKCVELPCGKRLRVHECRLLNKSE